MDKLDKELAIEKFTKTMRGSLNDIEKLISFLNIEDTKHKKLLEESIKMIDKKLNKVEKCDSIEETKKYIKVKKVIKKYGE